HPHRGFETVTYMLEGTFRHRDSFGFSGTLRPGDVQWMTAGAGVVHSELPDDEIVRRGGRVHGVQLWVNLPAADKWRQPRYQDTPAHWIPEVTGDWGRARIIAGQALGAEAVIQTRIPILYLHMTLVPGGRVELPLPAEESAFLYLLAGSGRVEVSGARLEAGQIAVLGEGDSVSPACPTGEERP
ncbi:MAG: pirin family protein, partial [Gemmatimonadetes bacterium]|nr:pirin family protein [Gemmatimonadota bacterium]